MNKFEKIAYLKLIDQDTENLVWFSKYARSNKSIILHACKKDPAAIRHATKDLRENAAFVYSTQGRNPHKLKALLEKYPQLATQKLSAVVAVYEDPIAFAELPKEAFLDKEFIGVCKSAIGYKIDELSKGRSPFDKSEVGLANSLYRFVCETEQLRAFENNETESEEIKIQTKHIPNIVRELRNSSK